MRSNQVAEGASATPVSPLRYRVWLHALAVVLMLCTFVLVGVGGNVTSLDAGMAVPDWPGTYGYNMFLAPLDVWVRDPATGQWFHGRFWEHLHRLMGSLVGLLSIGIAVACWVTQLTRPWLRWLGLGLLGGVIIQGLMGGFRVTENSVLLAGIHGVFGQLVFAATVLIAAALGRIWIGSYVERSSLPSLREGQGEGPADREMPARAPATRVVGGTPTQPPPEGEGPNRPALWRWELGVLVACVGFVIAMIFLRASHTSDLIIMSLVEAVGVIGAMAVFVAIVLWRLLPAAWRIGRKVGLPIWRAPQLAALVLWGALVIQLVLGAAVRHSGSDRAIPDAPLSYGRLVPPLSQGELDRAIATLPPPPESPIVPTDTTVGQVWLQHAHRALGFTVAGLVGLVVVVVLTSRRQNLVVVFPSLMLTVAVTGLQILLGIMTVWSGTYPTMATLHQATGAALLGLVTWLAVRTHLADESTSAARVVETRYNPELAPPGLSGSAA